MDQTARRAELNKLRTQVAPLESELIPECGRREWAPRAYYTTNHILAGMLLGLAGAMTSLLFNIIGAAMVGGRDRADQPRWLSANQIHRQQRMRRETVLAAMLSGDLPYEQRGRIRYARECDVVAWEQQRLNHGPAARRQDVPPDFIEFL